MLIALACASLAAWAVLLGLRHGFWRGDQRLDANAADPDRWPGVAALVPARNEEASVAQCLTALAGQDYPGGFSILFINDASTDETAGIAGAVASHRYRLRVVDAPPLEPGWAGKLWALQYGVELAGSGPDAPDYLWLTDADVVHAPDTLRRLVAKAERQDLAMVSLMVRLACTSPWERLLVPAFIFFFQMLYPFRAVNDRSLRTAGAAGGCILLRRQVLADAGGFAGLKDRLIDDCALGALIKGQGHGIWLGLGENSHSLRRYMRLSEFWEMVARSAFVQLRHSALRLVASVAGISMAFLSAPLIVVGYPAHGDPAAMAVAAVSWAVMTCAYLPTVRYHGLKAHNSLLLAPAAALYLAMTMDSARRHWSGLGPSWKNRTYAPK